MTAKIVKTPGTCSGDARLDGYRIKVRDIVGYVVYQDYSYEKVSDSLNITIEQVQVAMDYYHNHIDEIQAEEERALRVAEQYRPQHTSLLKAKLEAARSASSA